MKTKKNHKLLSLLLAVFMMFSIPTYTYAPVQAATTTTASTLKNQTKNLVMIKGQKTSLKPPVKMTYSSSNSKIVYVNSKGNILARAKGSATVTGRYKSIKWIYKIKVEQPKLSRTSLSMTTGKYYQLKVSGTTRKQTWSSSNSKIAYVYQNGKVRAKRAGTAYISVRINGINYRCKVTVKASQSVIPEKPVTNTVWLSATGSKYHRIPNCGRMNPDKARPVDLSYAKSHGYTACDKCF